MSFTSDDYRTAASVIAEEFGEKWTVDCLLEHAARVAEREDYMHKLGMVGHLDTPSERGKKLVIYLTNNGWKPPDDLLDVWQRQ